MLFHGRYQIQRAIRSGGMGEVYRATDKQSGMIVAIKRMLVEAPSQGADEGALYHAQRFEEECKLLQNLCFPGIPSFVDSFSDGDRRVIVMEFIEGVDLEKQVMDQIGLTGEDLPVLEAVEYTIQVAKILEYLHAHRPRPIVHRDVKPANIIVRHSDNRLYLVDFGLAREVGGHTNTKTAVGTVGYAPMEQYRGHPSTRTDQYSLAVTLHFMLSGQQPLPLQVEPLDKIKPELPHELCWVVRKATQKEQEDRFESMYEFRRELEKLLPSLQDFQRRKFASVHVQDRLDLMGPTQELAEVYIPSQRVKIEGIHQEAAHPMDNFGLEHPLKNTMSLQSDFQRQAVRAEMLQRAGGHESESLTQSHWSRWRGWVYILALLLGVGALYYLNGRQQRQIAAEASGDALTVVRAAGLFRHDGKVGAGRAKMGWVEYLLSFPHPHNDGIRVALGQEKRSLIRAQFEAPPSQQVPLLLSFLDAEGKSISSNWYLVKGERFARSTKEPNGKSLTLNSTFTIPSEPKGPFVGEHSIPYPPKASSLLILVPSESKGWVYINLATR